MIRCYCSSLLWGRALPSPPILRLAQSSFAGTGIAEKKNNFENEKSKVRKEKDEQKVDHQQNMEFQADANHGWTPNALWLLPPTVALPNTTVFRCP